MCSSLPQKCGPTVGCHTKKCQSLSVHSAFASPQNLSCHAPSHEGAGGRTTAHSALLYVLRSASLTLSRASVMNADIPIAVMRVSRTAQCSPARQSHRDHHDIDRLSSPDYRGLSNPSQSALASGLFRPDRHKGDDISSFSLVSVDSPEFTLGPSPTSTLRRIPCGGRPTSWPRNSKAREPVGQAASKKLLALSVSGPKRAPWGGFRRSPVVHVGHHVRRRTTPRFDGKCLPKLSMPGRIAVIGSARC
jgi:hypothetical protein